MKLYVRHRVHYYHWIDPKDFGRVNRITMTDEKGAVTTRWVFVLPFKSFGFDHNWDSPREGLRAVGWSPKLGWKVGHLFGYDD